MKQKKTSEKPLSDDIALADKTETGRSEEKQTNPKKLQARKTAIRFESALRKKSSPSTAKYRSTDQSAEKAEVYKSIGFEPTAETADSSPDAGTVHKKDSAADKKSPFRSDSKTKKQRSKKAVSSFQDDKGQKRISGKSRFFASASGITERFYRSLQSSYTGKLMTSDKSIAKGTSEQSENAGGFFAYYLGLLQIRKKFIIPAKRFCNKQLENSAILSFLRSALKNLLALSVKFYGILAFSFGMYTSVAYIVTHYVLGNTNLDISSLYTGIICAIVTSPLIFMKGSLSDAILHSRILKFILIRFLGIKKERLYAERELPGKSYIAFICGMLLGILTMRIRCIYIIAAVPIIILAYIVLIKPESGVIAMMLILPLADSPSVAVFAICYTFFCYLLKLICGKRTFKLRAADIFVLIFAFLLLESGLVSVSLESKAAVMPFFCFTLGYFLVTNLINSSDRAYRCIYALVMSSAAAAICGAVSALSGSISIGGSGVKLTGISGNGISFAGYLIITLPIILAFLSVSKNHNARFGALLTLMLSIGCLVIEMPEGALTGLVIGILLSLIIYNKKAFAALFVLLVIFVLMYYSLYDWLPSGITNIVKLLANPYSLASGRTNGLVDLVNACVLCGIGFGGNAFSTAYAYFAKSAVPSTDFANNMFIQIITETGIVGLFIFILAIILAMREYFTFIKTAPSGKSAKAATAYSAACIGGIAAALLYGSTPGIWHNFRIMPVFYMICGLIPAITRSSCAERTESLPDGPYAELYYPIS